jgi:hypothetical protein
MVEALRGLESQEIGGGAHGVIIDEEVPLCMCGRNSGGVKSSEQWCICVQHLVENPSSCFLLIRISFT